MLLSQNEDFYLFFMVTYSVYLLHSQKNDVSIICFFFLKLFFIVTYSVYLLHSQKNDVSIICFFFPEIILI